MNEKEVIKYCLEHNMSVNYGRLSISDIHLSSGYKGKRRYQVYRESKNAFAENYLTVDEAVEKFLELKKELKPYVY